MKKNIFLFFYVITTFNSTAQFDCNYDLNFSNGEESIHVIIDTISDPTNLWQIGTQQKSFFTTTLGEIVIVTDTINPYSLNDTSEFIIKHVACLGFGDFGGTGMISGMYQVDSDSLNDYGKIEFSPDNGISWVLISKDTLIYNLSGWPTYIYNTNFTGTTNGSELFVIDISFANEIFNINVGDTILFKFIFISDNISETKDGLLFDNLQVLDIAPWGFGEFHRKDIVIFPNPVQNEINFTGVKIENAEVIIYSLDGKEILRKKNVDEQKIDVSGLSKGNYVLKIISESDVYSAQFFKE